MTYPIPVFSGIGKRRIVIPFTATLAAGASLTYVSGRIDIAYAVVEAEIVFRNDAANLLDIYILTSSNTNVSAGAPPPDFNVFSRYSPAGFFRGEGLKKHIECNTPIDINEKYVKVHAVNGCAYAQTISVTVTIEEA